MEKDAGGFTCLHDAARQGHRDIVARFLVNKDLVSERDKQGNTACTLAKRASHSGVLRLFRNAKKRCFEEGT